MRSALILASLLFLLALPAARARAADLPPELPGLEQEGEKWFHEAGKTDLSMGERNEARKKAWANLWKAKEILDRHWDAHPADQERLEDRMIKVGQMVFWLRKESPMGLLESTGVGPAPAPPRRRPDPGPPPPVREGGAPSAPEGKGDAPAPSPAAPAAPSIEDAWREVEAFARKYRADVPAVLARLQEFMSDFQDRDSHPDFLAAARRFGGLTAKLKDSYRRMRDEDPDSLKNVDGDEVRALVIHLGRTMSSSDPADRKRAADLLGQIGSGEGIFPLVNAARREDDPVALQAEFGAVVSIGGRKAVARLGTLAGDGKLAGRALDALQELTAKNAVDRRLAIEEVGDFALAKDDAVAAKAVDFLVSLGAEGAFGLVKGLDSRSTEVRLKIIPALGATKSPRVARPLARFLILSDNPNTRRCREAAAEAIKSLGEPAVPYLFAGLRSPATKLWTGAVLREMTGQAFSASRPGDWVRWWKAAHPDWEEEKD